VTDHLSVVVDEEAREQFLTSDEVETLKSANFNWCQLIYSNPRTTSYLTSLPVGYFVDLDSKFSGVGPDVRAIATKVLNGVGEVAVTQFLLCRNLMSRAGEQGRHEQQHPLSSVEHAKTIISTTAATSPGLDVEWIHAMIDRCDAFASEGEWDEREDLEEDIEYLQAKKAGLERELELEPPLPT
jgi:hypothetical protein